MKEDSLGPPKRYLGAGIRIFTDNQGTECWAFTLDDYIKVAVDDVMKDLAKEGKKLKGKAYRPYDSKYRPELDITPELDDKGAAKYQGYMGVF